MSSSSHCHFISDHLPSAIFVCSAAFIPRAYDTNHTEANGLFLITSSPPSLHHARFDNFSVP
ncbi:hypothetical protein Mapa_015460 [Marchantia paleacea]|nr:hypothetical protein Mapa_015460 [Marchantia paleacea]